MLINFLEDVSKKVANADQLGKTASVLSGITKVKAEVTQESKVHIVILFNNNLTILLSEQQPRRLRTRKPLGFRESTCTHIM